MCSFSLMCSVREGPVVMGLGPVNHMESFLTGTVFLAADNRPLRYTHTHTHSPQVDQRCRSKGTGTPVDTTPPGIACCDGKGPV